MRAILSATALAFLVSASALAADGEAEKATKDVMRQSFRASLKNRSEREALTTAVNTWCKAILAEAPTNSPAEQEWVAKEGQTINSERVNRLVRTPEFARQQIAEAFGDCVQRSGVAMEAQLLPMDAATLRIEAANLVSLGLVFSSPNDLAAHAQTVGIDGERLGFPLLMHLRNSIDIAALRAIEDMRF